MSEYLFCNERNIVPERHTIEHKNKTVTAAHIFTVPVGTEHYEAGRALNWDLTYRAECHQVWPSYYRDSTGACVLRGFELIEEALGYWVIDATGLNISQCKQMIKTIHKYPQFWTPLTPEVLAEYEAKVAAYTPPARRPRAPSVRQVLLKLVAQLPNEPELEDKLRQILTGAKLMSPAAQK